MIAWHVFLVLFKKSLIINTMGYTYSFSFDFAMLVKYKIASKLTASSDISPERLVKYYNCQICPFPTIFTANNR